MKKGDRVHVSGNVTIKSKSFEVDSDGTMLENTKKGSKYAMVQLDFHGGVQNVIVPKVPVRCIKRLDRLK